MMLARRYARALYEEAERVAKTERVDEDVELIRASLENSSELVSFFRSPIISREKKASVVRELFEGRLDTLTLRFMILLVEKQREDAFPEIVDAYRSMRYRQLGIIEATARVASPLPDEDRDQLIAALEKMTGKRVRLEVSEVEDLLGGIVIRVEDTVYDGSVRHHLDRLRDQMEFGGYTLN